MTWGILDEKGMRKGWTAFTDISETGYRIIQLPTLLYHCCRDIGSVIVHAVIARMGGLCDSRR